MEENKEQPFVTVFIPVYNPPIEYFRKCIESVLNQTYTNFELLLLDDGSDNGCFEAALDLVESDERIKVYHLAHNFTATLNYGLSIAKGKYLIRHDSDDEMFPTRIEDQVAVMEADPEIAICFGGFTHYGKLYNIGNINTKESALEYLKYIKTDTAYYIYGGTMAFSNNFLKNHHIKYDKAFNYIDDRKICYDICINGGSVYNLKKCCINYKQLLSGLTHATNENGVNINYKQGRLLQDWFNQNYNKFVNELIKKGYKYVRRDYPQD